MKTLKRLAGKAANKYTAFGIAMTAPVMALADPVDPAQVAADKINGLVAGVGTVGAAILGLTLAAVGFFVIGIQTAAIIMAALSGNNDFKTAKQFTAYLGLDPAEYKSGTSVKGKDRISKVGDCITRAALFSPALVAYRIGTFPRLVANMRQNGKHIMQILTAIMRKLTVVAYTLHKTDTTFEKQRHTKTQRKAA